MIRPRLEYDAVTPVVPAIPGKAKRKKPHWQKIGRAWCGGPGEKITIILDSLPFRSEYIYLFPKDDEDAKPPPPSDDDAPPEAA